MRSVVGVTKVKTGLVPVDNRKATAVTTGLIFFFFLFERRGGFYAATMRFTICYSSGKCAHARSFDRCSARGRIVSIPNDGEYSPFRSALTSFSRLFPLGSSGALSVR